MTSREIVGTAFVLGGLYLIFSAVAGVVSGAAGSLEVLLAPGRPLVSAALGIVVVSTVTILLVGTIFGILPGWYVIVNSSRWAERLSQDSTDRGALEPTLLLGVASMVLGISIGIDGVASGLAFAVVAIAAESLNTHLVSLAHGLVYSVAGIWLFRWGRAKVSAAS